MPAAGLLLCGMCGLASRRRYTVMPRVRSSVVAPCLKGTVYLRFGVRITGVAPGTVLFAGGKSGSLSLNAGLVDTGGLRRKKLCGEIEDGAEPGLGGFVPIVVAVFRKSASVVCVRSPAAGGTPSTSSLFTSGPFKSTTIL